MKTSIPPGSKSPTRKWPNSTFFATTSTENGTMQSSQDPQKQRDKLSTLPYPRSDTVKNLFGITNYDDFERIEAAIVTARYAEIIAGHGPQDKFDADHIKALHRHLFQDIYQWAGRTRDERVALSDGTIACEPNLRKADGQ